jgi:hypothetical protein
MLANALVILPDFALILFGWVLAHRFSFERAFWAGAEKIVYYVLFPPLLFNAISSAQFSLTTDLLVLAAAAGAFLCAVALGAAARPWLKKPPATFAACLQTGFRYNSYIGLAIAQSLLGAKGVALLALIISILVPLANLIAVYAIARSREANLLRELATNPLIIATLSGLACNLLGVALPPWLSGFFGKLGAASLALGLLCIGAGLTMAAAGGNRALVAYFVAVKLLAFPAVALALIYVFGLHGVQAQLVLLFAALPTASSAYVLAVRMGADAAPVAVIVTVQTCLSMATLPVWVSIAPA